MSIKKETVNMKKKIYETPMVTVTAIETEPFCAASFSNELDSYNEIDGTEMMSKENYDFDLWDEE